MSALLATDTVPSLRRATAPWTPAIVPDPPAAPEPVVATVAAVVAAYNEEDRIGPVLETLVSYPGFTKVIVVDDGSTDRTAQVAESYGADCLRLPSNRGKGAAMDAGVRHAGTEVIFFADADIQELTHATIDEIVAPVAAGEVDMFVAMRHRSVYHLKSALRVLPLLGGERAVTADLWHALPSRYRHRFKIETALNSYAVHHGNGLRYRVFGISQTTKERKYGLVRGGAQRARMTANVLGAMLEVQVNEMPADAKARRRAALTAAAGAAGVAEGVRRAATAPGTGRKLGGGLMALAGAAVGVTQLVRLAQSQQRADADD